MKSHFLAVGVHGLYSISGNFLIQPLFDLNIWVQFPWGGETLLRFHGSPNGKMVRSSAWSIPVFNEFNGLPMFDRWIPMKSHKLQFHVCSTSKSVHCVWPSQPRQPVISGRKVETPVGNSTEIDSKFKYIIISHHLYIDKYIYIHMITCYFIWDLKISYRSHALDFVHTGSSPVTFSWPAKWQPQREKMSSPGFSMGKLPSNVDISHGFCSGFLKMDPKIMAGIIMGESLYVVNHPKKMGLRYQNLSTTLWKSVRG